MADADILIAGAGAAGLSLAWALTRPGQPPRSITLIDRDDKRANDRTWCFWERGDNPFEEIVYRRWADLRFVTAAGRSVDLDLRGHVYKMIRGSDFYAHLRQRLEGVPGVRWVQAGIEDVTESGEQAAIHLADGRTLTARWAFTSLPMVKAVPPGRIWLWQDFVGWTVRVDQPVFDPRRATLMDFRVPQAGETRFVYVLPLSAREALVEHTLFGAERLPVAAHEAALDAYLRGVLGLERFDILDREHGAIPMTDAPPPRPGGAVVAIGTAGGASKPSTGYTFRRIQAQTGAIARNLAAGRPPLAGFAYGPRRFGWYDRALLNVLALGRRPGARVFEDLFTRLPAGDVLDFLSETASVGQELRVLAAGAPLPFMTAMADVFVRTLRGSAGGRR